MHKGKVFLLAVIAVMVTLLGVACSDSEVSEDEFNDLAAEVSVLKAAVEEQQIQNEIYNLLMNYEWCVDNSLEPWASDLFASIFAEDAEYSIPAFNMVVEGRGEIQGMFDNWIAGAQVDAFSHIAGVVVEIDGDTATGRDSFYHMGWNEENPSRDWQDLEITAGWHKYEFAKIDGEWKITWMEGQPRYNSANVE